MNIYTILFGLWLLVYGFIKSVDSLNSPMDIDRNCHGRSKINSYLIKMNKALEPSARLSKFIISLLLILIGIKFLSLGINGTSIIEGIRELAN